MRNLVTALDYESGIDYVDIYDNLIDLARQQTVRAAMSFCNGRMTHLAEEAPRWLHELSDGTRFEILTNRWSLTTIPSTSIDDQRSVSCGNIWDQNSFELRVRRAVKA